MIIGNGIEMLEISAEVMGRPGTINPTLIWDNDTIILVDTGFPGQLPLIRAATKKAGVPFEKISKIILTHHDIDHIGSLSSIVKELGNSVKVIAYKEEKAYIQGDKVPHKLAKLEENISSLPEEMKGKYKMMKEGFQKCKTNVDQVLEDSEELPYCGGIITIYTPGHTIGHICLYLKQSKTLIAGDLLFVEEGKLSKAPAAINYDNELTNKSLKRLTEYDIETVICYHGGVYRDNVNKSIKQLANQGK